MIHIKKECAFLLLIILNNVNADIYENTSDICRRCTCKNMDGNLNVNCVNKGVEHTLANWPTSNQSIISITAAFSYNTIHYLRALPPTNVSLIVRYDHCNITQLEDGLMENCVHINSLDLSYNLLEAHQLHSAVFKGPYKNDQYEPIGLEQLDLSYNQIHSIEKNCFEHMLSLKRLNLEGNSFRIIDVQTELSFSKLGKLEYLNLANNKLVYVSNTLFKPMPNLRVLNVSKNDMDWIPDAVHILKNLRTLILDENPIRELTDKSFLGMDSLVEISAKRFKYLDEIRTNTFAHLRNLKSLDMSEIYLTIDIGDQAFGNITNLREVIFYNGNLRRLPLNMLNWTELKVLDIRKNDLSCECDLVKIVERLPQGIKMQKDGPFCYDMKRSMQREIYTLKEDDCYEVYDGKIYSRRGNSFSDLRIMRMSLLMLIVILIVCTAVTLWLGYNKYLNTRQSYPFATTIIYNPITVARH